MKQILFVDDEPRVLEGLRRMLRGRRDEWEMSFANSGAEALSLLERNNFDVLVTDMRMPGMEGSELLERVQELYPGVVRIVLSGHVDMEAALRAAPVAHQFLSKPCDPGKLREAIERSCECRQSAGDENIRRIVGAVGKLPSLPTTCATLMNAVQDPDVNLTRVARIIEQDVGMTAKILQLVNSAFFGSRNSISSVRAAVSYLGLDTLQQLILSVEILRTFQPPPNSGFSLAQFDAHSRSAARIAARLPLSKALSPAAVVAALLHDAGKLVLATRLPFQYGLAVRASTEQRVPLHTLEQSLTGISHAHVGAYLLELWGLPDPIVAAVRSHHEPTASPVAAPELDILAATHIADALAHELNDRPAGNSLLNEEYLTALGLADQVSTWREIAHQTAPTGVAA